MSDSTDEPGRPFSITVTSLFSQELLRALQGARAGCSLDSNTHTITIRGGPADGQQFRPDATGTFVRVLPDAERDR